MQRGRGGQRRQIGDLCVGAIEPLQGCGFADQGEVADLGARAIQRAQLAQGGEAGEIGETGPDQGELLQFGQSGTLLQPAIDLVRRAVMAGRLVVIVRAAEAVAE